MNVIVKALSRFGPSRLAAMGAVTLALIGFFAFVITRVSQPAMGVLFAELASGDASGIIRELDSRAVRYETRDDGQTILVPRADIARIRMELASKGMPAGGGVGYEIFDKGDAFSSTSFVQNINHLRALEGELSRTIRTIGRVQTARVHLALPERRLFERDREAARASIVLKLRGELGSDQVQAIRHLVASAVEGLSPERISIVDERGRLLADGAGGGDASAGPAITDRRIALERRLRTQVEEIVTGIVGSGRTRVQVSAELEMSRIESRSENYDPEGKVVRSTQTRGENSATSSSEGQVSVGNELPGAKDAAPAAPRDNSAKNEEVVNYEISRTTRTEVQEAGRVKRLSVAVLVDGIYKAVAGAEPAYQARSKEDLDRIAALVRSAIGFDKSRGDQVEVVNMPFADTPTAIEAEKTSLLGSLLSPTKEDVLRYIELGVIALLTMVVLMVVVRPMVKRILSPDAIAMAQDLVGGPGASMALVGGGVGHDGALALSDGSGPADGEPALPAINSAASAQITRLGELAKREPKQTAAVLRGWMSEGLMAGPTATNARRFLFGDDFRDPAPQASAEPADPFRAEREMVEQAAYARGLEAGRRAAEAETERRIAEAVERAADAAAAALQTIDARGREIESLGVSFFHALAAKLAGRALASQPLAAIAEAAENAFRHVRGVPHLAVRVSADLVEAVDALLKPMARERGFEGRIIVIGDDQIAAGDARIEWADGGVLRDGAAIDQQVAAVLAAHRAHH